MTVSMTLPAAPTRPLSAPAVHSTRLGSSNVTPNADPSWSRLVVSCRFDAVGMAATYATRKLCPYVPADVYGPTGRHLLYRRTAKCKHAEKSQAVKAAKKKKKVKKGAVVPSDAVSAVETHPCSKENTYPPHAAMRPFSI